LEELAIAGVSEEDIIVVMALGLHRSMGETEIKSAVGDDIYRRLRVINHDPNHTARIGHTSAGTPVEIFRPVVEADLRICLGNLELHYFAGFSGGAKAILPGCASEATIRANHAMMVAPDATTGRLKGNPVRADIEEGVGLLGVDFILNVLVNRQHQIIKAVAGDVIAAHRQGCRFVAQRCMVSIPQAADIALVSAGGYPKDVNLYQAQKAMDNATNAVREGGIIVLVVECCEGYGNQTFESWMRGLCSPDDILARIQDDFVMGGHKAAAFAKVLKQAEIYLVSNLQADSVQSCGMEPFHNVVDAMDAALNVVGPAARVAVFPQGGSVLPVVEG
jgi:nickel-dependent lactate racemase